MMPQSPRNELLARVYIVLMLFILLSLGILYRVVKVNVVEGEKWSKKIERNLKWKVVEGDRGNIFSDDGSLLAVSQPFFEIRFDLVSPHGTKVFDPGIDSLAYYISTQLRPDKSPIGWKKELIKVRKLGKERKMPGARYYFICSNIGYDQLKKVREFPIFKEGRYRGGLIVEQRSKRTNPYNELAKRTVGEDRKNAGKVGLEYAYDKYLKGQTVKRLYKKLPSKNWIPMSELDNNLLNKGADLITTLNVPIQDMVHQALMRKLYETDARAGVAIVMDVSSGGIKAMSNLSKNRIGAYEEIYNYSVDDEGRFEPGSTFKLATVLALLESGHITKDTKVDLELGRKKFRGIMIKDSEWHGKNVVTMSEAFSMSSNVGMAKLAEQYFNKSSESKQEFIRSLKLMGLSEKTGVDLIGESKPVLKDPVLDKKVFWKNTVPWMAHGYEVEQTPLQILTFYNGVANDGRVMKPRLMKEIIQNGKVIKKSQAQVINKNLASSYSINIAQDLLRKVVTDGTAKSLNGCSVEVAGKTGTSRTNYDTDEEIKKYNASFVGYFPANEPKYSCIVVLYDVYKAGQIYGSQSAVPVFREIVERISGLGQEYDVANENENVSFASLSGTVKGHFSDVKNILDYAKIPCERNSYKWISATGDNEAIEFERLKIAKKTVPDVRGMGIRDAIYILENLGYEVEFMGVGKVKSQSLPPRSKATKKKIELELE